MCGIFGYFPLNVLSNKEKLKVYKAYLSLQSRGPDKSTYNELKEYNYTMYLGFHRLSILDSSSSGDQPFILDLKDDENNKTIYSICNGEIYNYKQLILEHSLESSIKSGSDCEVIPHLYAKFGFTAMIKLLRGEFAICILEIDRKTQTINVYIGRDRSAVRPVFVSEDERGFGFSSTLSGIVNRNSTNVRQLNSAEILHFELNGESPPRLVQSYYHDINNVTPLEDCKIEKILSLIREKFIESVEIRLQSDRQVAALLSGGLDSSLVVSIASSYLRKTGLTLKTFSIGIPGSTDRNYAEMVSLHCGTEHMHVEFTEKDFLDAIPEVIGAIESYDITTVRASIGQYLISKYLNTNFPTIKVLLIGDGSDELTSGYMYFHNAPNSLESHTENIRLLKSIHLYDSLRADRCIAYNGIEARVPFLDQEFVELYLSLPYELRVPLHNNETKRRTEKYLLRSAFDVLNDEGLSFLPQAVLQRKKEAFSDGVSSENKSLYSIIQQNLETSEIKNTFETDFHLKPHTLEALYYRSIFNEYFGYKSAVVIPYYWLPKWSGNVVDPSARVLSVYNT